MVDINISNGQGITQALAKNLNLGKEELKGIKQSTWTSVMQLVNDANNQAVKNNQASIFAKGKTADVSKLHDKSTFQKNFQVDAGTVKIDDGIFAKIKQLLTPSAAKATQATEEAQAPAKTNQTTQTTGTQAAAKTQAPETTTVNGILKTNAPVLAQNTTLEGDAKTGAKISQIFDQMSSDSNVKLPVTSNEWRELAGKKNKTPEDIKKLDAEYNTNIKKLGNSLTKHISETYANGGDIDMKAFSRFQDAGMNLEGVSDEDKATIKKQNEILFNKIDQDHDGKIGNKELSAYMHVLDFNEKGQMNGIIDAKDVYRTAFLAQNPEEGMMDKMLKYSYNKLYGNE